MARISVFVLLALVAITHATTAPSAAPTTAAPSVAPTTAAPSGAPTTGNPTTAAPSVAPTTATPSVAPTTAAPTTATPSTAPTTAAPSVAPTTAAPTTAAPTPAPTFAPTTSPTAQHGSTAITVSLTPGGSQSINISSGNATRPDYIVTFKQDVAVQSNDALSVFAMNDADVLATPCSWLVSPGHVLAAFYVSSGSFTPAPLPPVAVTVDLSALPYNSPSRALRTCYNGTWHTLDQMCVDAPANGTIAASSSTASTVSGTLCAFNVPLLVVESATASDLTCDTGMFGCDCASTSSTYTESSSYTSLLVVAMVGMILYTVYLWAGMNFRWVFAWPLRVSAALAGYAMQMVAMYAVFYKRPTAVNEDYPSTTASDRTWFILLCTCALAWRGFCVWRTVRKPTNNCCSHERRHGCGFVEAGLATSVLGANLPIAHYGRAHLYQGSAVDILALVAFVDLVAALVSMCECANAQTPVPQATDKTPNTASEADDAPLMAYKKEGDGCCTCTKIAWFGHLKYGLIAVAYALAYEALIYRNCDNTMASANAAVYYYH